MTRDEILSKVEEMNKALSDEEMSLASGGSDEPSCEPLYRIGDTLYIKGLEASAGPGTVTALRWINFCWWYTIDNPVLGRPIEIPEMRLHP
ncbi:MAG: hypothetical protein E7308_11195 [Butyrivibrio sp.]|nr:hypothetical protein [Butyrivibrio sp.]